MAQETDWQQALDLLASGDRENRNRAVKIIQENTSLLYGDVEWRMTQIVQADDDEEAQLICVELLPLTDVTDDPTSVIDFALRSRSRAVRLAMARRLRDHFSCSDPRSTFIRLSQCEDEEVAAPAVDFLVNNSQDEEVGSYLIASLSNFSNGLRNSIVDGLQRRIGNDQPVYSPLRRSIEGLPPAYPDRESTRRELCLNIHELAVPVCEFINSARGDFSFAILGGWGTGKTTLAREVGRRLEIKGHRFVELNAWQYRTREAIWANLFENLLEKLTSGDRFRRLALAMRSHLAKHGPILSGILLGLTLAPAMPIGVTLRTATSLASALGLGASAVIVFLILRGKSLVRSPFGTRMGFRSFEEELGLQHRVTGEIRSLLLGAFPSGTRLTRKAAHQFRKVAAIIAILYILFLLLIGPYFDIVDFSIYGKVSILIAAGLWGFGFVRIWKHLDPSEENAKLVLAVDDADRCSPKEMIEIIESVKLLTQDLEIQKRIQIMFLIDEEILRTELKSRFDIRDSPLSRHSKTMGTINAHIDKLFLSYIRMPQYGHHQYSQQLELLIESANHRHTEEQASREERTQDLNPQQPDSRAKSAGPKVGGAASPGEQVTNIHSSFQLSSLSRFDFCDSPMDAFSRTERQKLMEVTQKLALECNDPLLWNPRMLRLFVYRYQLLRLLVRASNIVYPVSDAELIEELARSYLSRIGLTGTRVSSGGFSEEDEYRRLVALVS